MAFEKVFFCAKCGVRLHRAHTACQCCGFDPQGPSPYGDLPQKGAGGEGWSIRTDDPRFAKYQTQKRTYIALFAAALVVFVPLVLFATGQLSISGEGLAVTGVIVAMFLSIALYSIKDTKRRGSGFEGVVEDKKPYVKTKNGAKRYVLFLRLTDGSLLDVAFSDNPALYEYYRVGDRIRCHQGVNLRAWEKYDKRQDEFLLCPSCGYLCDARAEYCQACGCPLLKGSEEE